MIRRTGITAFQDRVVCTLQNRTAWRLLRFIDNHCRLLSIHYSQHLPRHNVRHRSVRRLCDACDVGRQDDPENALGAKALNIVLTLDAERSHDADQMAQTTGHVVPDHRSCRSLSNASRPIHPTILRGTRSRSSPHLFGTHPEVRLRRRNGLYYILLALHQKLCIDHSLCLTVLYTGQDDNVNRRQHICQILPLDSLIQNISHLSKQPFSSKLDEMEHRATFRRRTEKTTVAFALRPWKPKKREDLPTRRVTQKCLKWLETRDEGESNATKPDNQNTFAVQGITQRNPDSPVLYNTSTSSI